MKVRYYIGIDPGTNTGLAIWDSELKKFNSIQTLKIHKAMEVIQTHAKYGNCHIMVEDARQIKLPQRFQKNINKNQSQGVGSVKRDCSIWEDFLKDHGFAFTMSWNSKGIRKLDSDRFKVMTGYTDRTSSHGRDAAMIVFGR